MPSSSRRRRSVATMAAVALGALASRRAAAQSQPQGFAVERFYPAPPGGGWMVMDDLDMHGALGGVIAFSGGYARKPLRLATPDRTQRFDLVSDQAFAEIGLSITFERFRFHLAVDSPLVIRGESGALGATSFAPPSVDLAKNPDTLSDVRLGFDARLFGGAASPLRVGLGWQLWVPSGERADYATDGTYRGMGRLLFAGTIGSFTYAGHVGVHFRPLSDSSIPGGPRGDELLFGLAAGPRFPIDARRSHVVVVGPELYGETAARAPFATSSTGLEALLTARLEGAREDAPQLRWKVGGGGGLHAHFGAPEWRMVFAVELLDRVR